MAKNVDVIPFTEIVERAAEIARIREDVSKKIRGIVNDVYVRDITRKEDWSFLIARSTLTFFSEYVTGTVSANTAGTALTFSSDVAIDSSMVGRQIKINQNDYVYSFAGMNGTTGGTISPPLSGTQNITSQTYSIFQPVYPLAADFDRFPKNGGLHTFFGGKKNVIPEKGYDYYLENYSPTTSDNPQLCRLVGTDTANRRLLEINPPPKSALSAEYDYLKTLRPMRETTAGMIGSISASGTAVTGDNNTHFTEANTGDYLRIDAFGTGADSEWYRIIAISGNSGLTLATAFGLSAATSANYTICSAPDIPTMIHPAILYGTITQLVTDQDDPMAPGYKQEYANVLSDGKRIYKTRFYREDIDSVATDYNYRR